MNRKRLLILLTLLTLLLSVLPGSAQDDEVEISYFVAEDASYAAILLDGWVAQASREGGLYMASSQETLDLLLSEDDDEAVMPSGEYGVLVFAGPMENPEEWDALSFLNDIIELIADPERDTVMSDVYEMEYDGRTLARIDASNDSTEAITLAYEIAPRTWALAILYSAPGEGETFSDLGLALVNAVAYSLPLEDTVEGTDGTSYLVPAGWVGDDSEGFLAVANNQEAFDAEELETGHYRIAMLEWDSESAETTADTVLNSLLEEDEYANDPVILTIGDQEVLQVAVRQSEDDLGIGGFIILEGEDGAPNLVAIYAAAPGESQQIGLTALNMVLNSQVPADTD